ncbi:hypothetical protein SEA_EMMA1919_130 [Streptomyces phage Emma1919]|uniref:Uncharacterized protein n=1 Tax=Streptomyces phage Gilson TaxID=2488789 RepID=A0A3Q9R4U1_9CAUD|nr:hypothetical protein HWB98_gp139 [Streptomyces phage Gilson]AZU97190.1 hypothetical protein SEA_GILSON_130 [Streptomyces phage Gilson]URQ04726.1 hypothetical protein SEA_EMMA1919_130 [Streptomyces phage Emma1919]
MAEQRAVNSKVVGSSPAGGATRTELGKERIWKPCNNLGKDGER